MNPSKAIAARLMEVNFEALNVYLTHRLEQLRGVLEKPQDEIKTATERGRIAELRELLTMRAAAEKSLSDENNV